MENIEGEINKFDVEETSVICNGSSVQNNDDDVDELKFDKIVETEAELEKKLLIEKALETKELTALKTWRNFAITSSGLISDDLRREIWPLLLEINVDKDEKIPSLEELSQHAEYQQVVLDVNRSLKRFPPGIPYKQRLALQDQLTVLILRVIIKYPHLKYYQGYHDVAITFLLVVGEAVAFRIMEVLSTKHLRECMEPTMERTSYKLNYIYALLSKVDADLYQYMNKAEVGTMFALPWYLTWFGHSLNQYKDVVRLYDFFLASPLEMPLYVSAALIIQRRDKIFAENCDMASIHCLLSQIPDDIDFELILEEAMEFYERYPPEVLEPMVKMRVENELEQRRKEEEKRRKLIRNRNRNRTLWLVFNYRNKYGLLFAAATVLLGYIYYLRITDNKYPFLSYFAT